MIPAIEYTLAWHLKPFVSLSVYGEGWGEMGWAEEGALSFALGSVPIIIKFSGFSSRHQSDLASKFHHKITINDINNIFCDCVNSYDL